MKNRRQSINPHEQPGKVENLLVKVGLFLAGAVFVLGLDVALHLSKHI